MTHWLDDFPAMRIVPGRIEAADFNRIRLAVLRHSGPLQLALPDLPCLLTVLDETAWICIDECQGAAPMLAWTNFQTARDALHQAVTCDIRFYHYDAGMMTTKVLDALVNAAAGQQRVALRRCASVTEL